MGSSIINLVSLARRAGCVDSGDASVRDSIERKRARLIIIACDAAERTQKNFESLARQAEIPVVLFGSRNSLGTVLGKESRAVLAITDEHFVKGIVMAIERGELLDQ